MLLAAIDRPVGVVIVVVVYLQEVAVWWYFQYCMYCAGTTGQEGGYRAQHKPRCASQGYRDGKTWQDETSFVLHLAFLGFLHQSNYRWCY